MSFKLSTVKRPTSFKLINDCVNKATKIAIGKKDKNFWLLGEKLIFEESKNGSTRGTQVTSAANMINITISILRLIDLHPHKTSDQCRNDDTHFS